MEKIYILKFDEKFIKNNDENSEKVYILETDVEYSKTFYQKEWKLRKFISNRNEKWINLYI